MTESVNEYFSPDSLGSVYLIGQCSNDSLYNLMQRSFPRKPLLAFRNFWYITITHVDDKINFCLTILVDDNILQEISNMSQFFFFSFF